MHEQDDFILDLGRFGPEPFELLARNIATGAIQEKDTPAQKIVTVVALAVVDLAFQVEELFHDLDTVVVSRDNAHGNRIALDEIDKITVGAGFGILVCQVAR